MPDDESTDELDILTSWALRFAGDAFEWDGEELAAATQQAVDSLAFPDSSTHRLALLFHLQRHLAKWGGEMLPRFAPEWRAFRALFLLTCSEDVSERWRAPERYQAWEAFARGRQSSLIGVVARAHANTLYAPPRTSSADDSPAPLRFYNLEAFLFGDVNWAYSVRKHLTAFEFFAIVIWKANRAKSLIAAKLLRLDSEKRRDLDAIVESLTSEIAACASHSDRLAVLMTKWRFALPMASAILTVLYPDCFSVYDVRTCEQLGNKTYNGLAARQWSGELWEAYRAFCDDVQSRHPMLALRDADRALWAQSAIHQLERDIQTCFGK